jgi:hypothetical protein
MALQMPWAVCCRSPEPDTRAGFPDLLWGFAVAIDVFAGS